MPILLRSPRKASSHIVAFFFLTFTCALADAPWHLTPAEFRFELVADAAHEPQGWRAGDSIPVSLARVCASGIDVTEYRPVVVGDNKRVACRTLWSHPEEPLDIIFDSSAGHERYYVYLIANRFKLKDLPWEPETGMILETRHLDAPATIVDAKTFVELWNTAAPAGRSFTPNVYQAFPIHRHAGPTPRSYQATADTMSLHRYVGYFHIDEVPPGFLSKMRNQAENAKSKLREVRSHYGQKKAALREAEAALPTLEKALAEAKARAESASGGEREQAIARKDARVAAQDLEEQQQRVKNAAHEVELSEKRHIPGAERRSSFTEAAIAEIRNNTYTFYTGSRGPSFVLLDGSPLTAWTESAPPPLKGDKYRNFKATSLNLQPGLHRIEYFYACPGDFLAMLAWRPPGERHSAIMPREVFAAHGRYKPVAAQHKEASDAPLFSWQVANDLRVPGGPDLVDMQLAVSAPREGWTYRWQFGDGVEATGPDQQHLYLGTGNFRVKLTGQAPSGALHSTEHSIHAHIRWAERKSAELEPIAERIATTDYSAAPIPQLINGYDFVRRASNKQQHYGAWRAKMRSALVARLDEFTSEHGLWAQQLGEDCASWRVRSYPDALRCYEKALELLPADHPQRPGALIGKAAILIRCLAQPQAGLETLKEAQEAGLTDTLLRPSQLLNAEAMLGIDEPPGAVIDYLRQLTPDRPLVEQTRADLKLRGVLRHARSLADAQDGPVQLQHAMDKLAWIIQEAPLQSLSPELNQVKMEIQLARQEYARVWVRSGYLLKLNLSELVRPKILALRVRALAGMGSTDEARKAFAQLVAQYPYSPAVTDAKRALR
jgi:hypothetical protein